MNERDEKAKRRARLRELRAQYREVGAAPAGGDESSDESAAAAPAARRGGGAGRGRRRAGAARGGRPGGGGGAGLRAALLKRLTETGDGDRLIPGTPVGEERLKQVLQVLRRRSESAEGRRAKRFSRVISYLTEAAPGDEVVAGVSVPRLKNFLKFLEGGGGGRRRGPRRGTGPGRGGGTERQVQNDLDEAFNELIDATEQVSAELQDTRARMAARGSELQDDAVEEPTKG
jgi:hypothetical protein